MSIPANLGCVYLHGFLSSPLSTKAQELSKYFDDHNISEQLRVPCLSFEPEDAIQQATEAIKSLQGQEGIDDVFLIGSSLGGYYATYLSQTMGLKAALINPAVKPFDLFEKYLGPNKHFYDGNTYLLEMKHIEQLKAINVKRLPQPHDLFLLLQTGDETLDYRQASDQYRQCTSWIEPGGDHSFIGFMDRLDMVFHFVK